MLAIASESFVLRCRMITAASLSPKMRLFLLSPSFCVRMRVRRIAEPTTCATEALSGCPLRVVSFQGPSSLVIYCPQRCSCGFSFRTSACLLILVSFSSFAGLLISDGQLLLLCECVLFLCLCALVLRGTCRCALAAARSLSLLLRVLLCIGADCSRNCR